MDTADSDSIKRAWLCNLLPYQGGWFLLWFLLFALFGVSQLFLADGAVARHFMTGYDILTRGTIPTTNYVWAVNPNAPWLTHELFGDIVFGAAFLWFGLNGVVTVGALVIGVSLMWAYQFARWRGLGKLTGWVVFFPVMIATSLHWLSRSHIFSYPCMLIIYHLTFIAPPERFALRLAVAVITMAIWVNFHGSFMIGLFILALPAIIQAIQQRTKESLKELIVPALSAVAVMCNPRGPLVFAYLFGYLTHSEIMGKGSEWRALDLSMGVGVYAFLLICVLFLILFARAPKRLMLAETIIVVSLMAAGFATMRIIPYFALLALPAMGALMARPKEATPDSLRKITVGSSIKAAIAVAICAAFLISPTYQIKDFPPHRLPVKAFEHAQSLGVSDKLGFSFDNWGPYIYYKTRHPIYIDEKTDFYPIPFMNEFHQTMNAQNDWQSVMNKYNIAYILVPPHTPLAKSARNSAQWKEVYRDQTAVLFIRK